MRSWEICFKKLTISVSYWNCFKFFLIRFSHYPSFSGAIKTILVRNFIWWNISFSASHIEERPKTGCSIEFLENCNSLFPEKRSSILSSRSNFKLSTCTRVCFSQIFAFVTCVRILKNWRCEKSANFLSKPRLSKFLFLLEYLLSSVYQVLNWYLSSCAKLCFWKTIDFVLSIKNKIVQKYAKRIFNSDTCPFSNSCFSVTTCLIWSKKVPVENCTMVKKRCNRKICDAPWLRVQFFLSTFQSRTLIDLNLNRWGLYLGRIYTAPWFKFSIVWRFQKELLIKIHSEIRTLFSSISSRLISSIKISIESQKHILKYSIEEQSFCSLVPRSDTSKLHKLAD